MRRLTGSLVFKLDPVLASARQCVELRYAVCWLGYWVKSPSKKVLLPTTPLSVILENLVCFWFLCNSRQR